MDRISVPREKRLVPNQVEAHRGGARTVATIQLAQGGALSSAPKACAGRQQAPAGMAGCCPLCLALPCRLVALGLEDSWCPSLAGLRPCCLRPWSHPTELGRTALPPSASFSKGVLLRQRGPLGSSSLGSSLTALLWPSVTLH